MLSASIWPKTWPHSCTVELDTLSVFLVLKQHGGDRHGGARHGGARHDGARHGGGGHDGARHGRARHGGARHGGARHGGAHGAPNSMHRAINLTIC